MSATKIIVIVLLLVIGAHLVLYGFLRRKIDAAKRAQDRKPD